MKKLLNTALSILIFLGICHFTSANDDDKYSVRTAHPRLVMTKEMELNLRFVFLDNQMAGNIKNNLKADADKLLDAKALKLDDDLSNNFNKVSKEYFYRIFTLSMAYRILEEDKYAESATEQMLIVSELPEWTHQDYKNAATLTAAMGIGYDWLYFYLNRRNRELVRNAIVDKGLKSSMDYLKNSESEEHASIGQETVPDKIICAGGVILGALSVADFFPDLNTQVLYHTLSSLQNDLMQFELEEHLGLEVEKWQDMQNFLSMMILSMEHSLGHDFGIKGSTAFGKAADQLTDLSIRSNEQVEAQFFQTPAMLWYSKGFDKPDLARMYLENLSNRIIPQNDQPLSVKQCYYLNLAWFDPPSPSASAE